MRPRCVSPVGPAVAPHVTKQPPRASEARQAAWVGAPIESMTTSTPRFFVHTRTWRDQSSPSSRIACSTPSSCARFNFHWWRLVTAIRHPIHRHNDSAAVATPPPIPVMSTTWPGRRPALRIIPYAVSDTSPNAAALTGSASPTIWTFETGARNCSRCAPLKCSPINS